MSLKTRQALGDLLPDSPILTRSASKSNRKLQEISTAGQEDNSRLSSLKSAKKRKGLNAQEKSATARQKRSKTECTESTQSIPSSFRVIATAPPPAMEQRDESWIGSFYLRLKQIENEKQNKIRKRMIAGKHSTDSSVQIGVKSRSNGMRHRFRKRIARRLTVDQHLRMQRESANLAPAGMYRKRALC